MPCRRASRVVSRGDPRGGVPCPHGACWRRRPLEEGDVIELGLELTERDGWAVLAVSGEVDVATAPRLRERLVGLVGEGRTRIVVDLEKVDFIDSTGLGVLVGALKRVRTNEGDLALVCTGPRILKVFEITGLTKVFAIHRSVDEATVSA
ncbi:STAS domain-containing protein [Iamia sp. SCSIO 61187]|nr:STAS domain-containing protein [Iamia sp. SCSIO 61187]